MIRYCRFKLTNYHVILYRVINLCNILPDQHVIASQKDILRTFRPANEDLIDTKEIQFLSMPIGNAMVFHCPHCLSRTITQKENTTTFILEIKNCTTIQSIFFWVNKVALKAHKKPLKTQGKHENGLRSSFKHKLRK